MTTERKEEAAFRRKILENPADDLARLVYADWLDDRGRPRAAALAALIRLQVARAEGGREKECDNCDGTGELIDPAGPCPVCGGQFEPRDDWTDRGWFPGTGKVADTSITRQLAVAESLKAEGAILQRWGVGWLPSVFRGPGCLYSVKGETITAIRPDWATSRVVFERGWPTWVNLELAIPVLLSTVAVRVRSMLAACPIQRVAIRFGSQESYFKFDQLPGGGGGWSAYVKPVNVTPSGSALVTFDNRRELVRRVVDFVMEFLPHATPRPEAYSRGYYEQGAAGEPVIPGIVEPWNQDLIDREQDVRNNFDMPHER